MFDNILLWWRRELKIVKICCVKIIKLLKIKRIGLVVNFIDL